MGTRGIITDIDGKNVIVRTDNNTYIKAGFDRVLCVPQIGTLVWIDENNYMVSVENRETIKKSNLNPAEMDFLFNNYYEMRLDAAKYKNRPFRSLIGAILSVPYSLIYALIYIDKLPNQEALQVILCAIMAISFIAGYAVGGCNAKVIATVFMAFLKSAGALAACALAQWYLIVKPLFLLAVSVGLLAIGVIVVAFIFTLSMVFFPVVSVILHTVSLFALRHKYYDIVESKQSEMILATQMQKM